MSNCFQLNGFPEWWNEKSGGRGTGKGCGEGSVRGRGRGAVQQRAYHAQTAEEAALGIPNFTADQWKSLAQFMNSQKSGADEKLSGKREKLLIMEKQSRFNVIIDSGASNHMTGDATLLTDVRSMVPCAIKLPDGGITWAMKCGTLPLGRKLVLQNVFLAPHLDITLISVAQLLKDINGFVLFTKQFCVIQDHNLKTLIGAGEERDGVYHYKGVLDAQADSASNLQSRDLWHRRLGHPSPRVLSFLSGVGVFKNNVGVLENSCDVCIRAKQTRDKFNESLNKADAPFSMIHCDLWGPYITSSSCGAHYFLTIVDDYSRAVWTLLLLEKS